MNDLFFILEVAKRFDVLVCGDSGLMHACSWITRVIAVFGPSDPKRWGPSALTGFRHRVFRKKDGVCDSVGSREVAQEVKKIWAKRPAK
jgi:ADP-heptose:LPS heptosyltransferase